MKNDLYNYLAKMKVGKIWRPFIHLFTLCLTWSRTAFVNTSENTIKASLNNGLVNVVRTQMPQKYEKWILMMSAANVQPPTYDTDYMSKKEATAQFSVI